MYNQTSFSVEACTLLKPSARAVSCWKAILDKGRRNRSAGPSFFSIVVKILLWFMLWIGCQLNDFIRRSWLRDAWRRLFMPVVPNRPMSDQALALWLLGMCSIFLKWNCLEYGAVLFWLDWVGNKRSFITPIDRLILTHWEFRMCWRHCLSFFLPLYACACVVCA